MKIRVFGVLLSVATLSIGAVYLFLRGASQGTLAFEAAKSLLQVGVVAVAGAVISLLTFEYQRARQDAEKEVEIKRVSDEKARDIARQEAEKQRDVDRHATEKQRDLDRKSVEYREGLLLSTLTAAMTAYGRAKKARRLLRARARIQREGVQVILAEQYDIYLDWINDAQIALENLARDIDTSRPAFSKADFLKDQLNMMDGYLNTLVSEYEEMRSRFEGQPPSLPLSELRVLTDFLLPAKQSRFLSSVIIPYHNVQQGLRQDLLHPSLASGTLTAHNVNRTAAP